MKIKPFLKQKGMRLIELMIGMVIAMILLAGVAEIFFGSKQTYRYQEGMARLQENGRYTIDLMTGQIRMAGYMGCYSIDSGELVNTVNGGGNVEYDFSKPIIAWEVDDTGRSYESWDDDGTTKTYASDVPADVRTLISGTPSGTDFSDILVFTGAGNSGIRLASGMPLPSAVIKLVMHEEGTLKTGDILLVSDCQKSAIFQATQVTYPSGGGTGASVNVVHNTGSGTPGNSQKELSNNGENFAEDASLYTLQKIYYFIAPSATNNNQGDTVMALWRKVNDDNPEELVAGISNLNILIGEDVDADKSADRYGDAHIVNLENAISVRVELESDTVDRIKTQSGATDPIKALTFTQTVTVRNRAL